MGFRHEYKHIVNLADLYILRSRLSSLFEHDSHADSDGTYIVKSLYFDNYADTALFEKANGVKEHEKFRIRYYGTDTSFMRLEKKSKVNSLIKKLSCPITYDECTKILNGDCAFLSRAEYGLMCELYAKMHTKLLRPKCIVSYTRESFVYSPGNVRITLDYAIGGSYDTKNFLNPKTDFLSLYPHCILEVKWDEYLPRIVRDSVSLNGKKSTSFSKYAAVRF